MFKTQTTNRMLSVRGLGASYGKSQVLFDVTLDVKPGESIALLGRNGVGKTTLLRTIIGLHPITKGNVSFDFDRKFAGKPTFERAYRGMAYVPQGRGIFPHLTVTENLLMGLPAVARRVGIEKEIPKLVYELFPVLHELKDRKGGNLSGGQQQQLAIGRALVTQPKILLLDEPTEGIQPNVVEQIEHALTKVKDELGVSIVLVEQYLDFAFSFADRFFVMQKGRIVDSGDTKTRTPQSVEQYIAV